jgi:hypothetical protein
VIAEWIGKFAQWSPISGSLAVMTLPALLSNPSGVQIGKFVRSAPHGVLRLAPRADFADNDNDRESAEMIAARPRRFTPRASTCSGRNTPCGITT